MYFFFKKGNISKRSLYSILQNTTKYTKCQPFLNPRITKITLIPISLFINQIDTTIYIINNTTPTAPLARPPAPPALTSSPAGVPSILLGSSVLTNYKLFLLLPLTCERGRLLRNKHTTVFCFYVPTYIYYACFII